jgi:formate C-acetyltransferase
MSERTEKLRKNLFDTKPQISAQRARFFTESMERSEGEYIGLRRANAFKYVLENIDIYLQDGELLVGSQAEEPKSAPIFPEYSYKWIEEEFAGKPYLFHERPGDRFYYTKDTEKEILEILNYWHGKTIYENFRKMLPEKCNQAWDIGAIDDTWVSAAGFGNVVADYGKIIDLGLEYYIDKINAKLKTLDLTEPQAYKKQWNLQSMLISIEAVVAYSRRFAEKARALAEKASSPERKAELLRIAQNCENVPLKPAASFHEGLQSVWMVLLAIHLETNGHAISLGRFDQFLWKLYSADVRSGKLTRADALELVEAFFIKCNELNKLRSWADSEFFLGYQMFINLAVGGQDEHGQDSVNELSYICLDACASMKLFTPSISIKHFDGTPDKFMDAALVALSKHNGGMPAFYNDKAFMRTLEDLGIEKQDLHNWVPDGCIEASIPGKWDFAAKGPWLSIGKILELTLNNGKDPNTGITVIPGEGYLPDFKSTNEILEAFKKQLHGFMELQVLTEHINDYMHVEYDLNSFRSALIDDCIERGLDLVEGGSKYSVDGGPTAGNITAGDSLAAIEYAVFKEKVITAEQLQHALATNFEDADTTPTGEQIQWILRNKAPKYGNDLDEADTWAAAVIGYIGKSYRYDFKSSKYGKGPVPCCYAISQTPVTGNVAFGKAAGATPDGRKAGKPFNNGISPNNGSEQSGPTAAINSVGKMPSLWFQKGAILNMRLTPKSLSTEAERARVIALIKVLFDKYGQHVQFNLMDNETYGNAQKHPEEYGDLLVRVSGYSTLFVPLAKEVQDDIMERTSFSM